MAAGDEQEEEEGGGGGGVVRRVPHCVTTCRGARRSLAPMCER